MEDTLPVLSPPPEALSCAVPQMERQTKTMSLSELEAVARSCVTELHTSRIDAISVAANITSQIPSETKRNRVTAWLETNDENSIQALTSEEKKAAGNIKEILRLLAQREHQWNVAIDFETLDRLLKSEIKDIAKIIRIRILASSEAIINREFVRKISECVASDGRCFLAPHGNHVPLAQEGKGKIYLKNPKFQNNNIEDYLFNEHPALRQWIWFGKANDGKVVLIEGDMKLHPDALHTMDKFFGTPKKLTVSRPVDVAINNLSNMPANRIALIATIVVLLAILIYPPWQLKDRSGHLRGNAYAVLWEPPTHLPDSTTKLAAALDVPRLLTSVTIVAVIGGAALCLTRKKQV